jgi:hypothetical protein
MAIDSRLRGNDERFSRILGIFRKLMRSHAAMPRDVHPRPPLLRSIRVYPRQSVANRSPTRMTTKPALV